MLEKLNSFTKDVSDLPDKPLITTAELKNWFDAAPNEVREYLNKLIDALMKTTAGDSGAKNIGVSPVTGLTGADVQTILQALKTEIDNTVIGQIPNTVLALYAKKQQPAWMAATLQNGWNNTGVADNIAGYMADELGYINLRGSVFGGAITEDTVLFTLPADMRPSKWTRLPIINTDGGTGTKLAFITIHPNGNVLLKKLQWNNFVYLDGLRFRLEG